MDGEAILMCLEELANKLGIEVRWDALGSEGGICTLRGKRILMVDESLSDAAKIEVMAEALCGEAIEEIYIRPEVREVLEKAKGRSM